MIIAKVGRLGGVVKEVALADGSKIRDAIAAMGLSINDGEEIHVTSSNGATLIMAQNTLAKNTDLIIIEPKTKQIANDVRAVMQIMFDEDLGEAGHYDDLDEYLKDQDHDDLEIAQDIVKAVRNS